MATEEPPARRPRRLQVYLDSSDFSDLSNPRKLSPQLNAVLDELLRIAGSEQVDFRFSMAHVCEAAPIDQDAVDAAERRARLMHRLCGSNTLATIEEIQDSETKPAQSFSALTQDRWYPPLDDLLPKFPVKDMKLRIREELKSTGCTRAERRRRERQIFRKDTWSRDAQRTFVALMPSNAQELLQVLPLSSQEMQALMSYLRGGSGREIAIKGCRRVLANPVWFMSRYAEDPEKMRGVTDWFRKGGSNFVSNMGTAVARAHDFFASRVEADKKTEAIIAAAGNSELREQLALQHRRAQQSLDSRIQNDRKRQEESILRTVTGHTKEAGSKLTFEQLQENYPGHAAMLAAGMHATRRATDQASPRPLQDSDFGDVMHAVYAPYVDIYRTDAFMADGIEKMLRKRGTKVVRNLLRLPDEIRASLGCATGLTNRPT